MKKIAKFLSWAIPITMIALVALPVLADIAPGGGEPEEGPTEIEDLMVIINDIITYFMWALIAFGIVMLIIAGFQFMTAAGDAEKTKGAQNKLLYGIIGIAVGLGAKGIIMIVANLLGVEVPGW